MRASARKASAATSPFDPKAGGPPTDENRYARSYVRTARAPAGVCHSHRGDRDREWDDLQIDIQVKLPKELLLDAHDVSGNVSVVGAEGQVRASSVSGDVRMERLWVSSIKATSVSGNVAVGIDAFTGDGPLTFTSV